MFLVSASLPHMSIMIGRVADIIAANRKLLQDTQYHTRKTEYDAIYMQMKAEKEAVKTYQMVGLYQDFYVILR